MKKLLIAALLAASSSAVLAATTTTTVVTAPADWTAYPITVQDTKYTYEGTLPASNYYFTSEGYICFSDDDVKAKKVTTITDDMKAVTTYESAAGGPAISCYKQ